jgi:hypothetical protein
MLDVFNLGYKTNGRLSITGTGRIPYYLDKVSLDLDNVKTYYRNRVDKVHTDNVLYRVLRALDINPDLDIIDVMDIVDIRLHSLCRINGIGSSVSYPNYDRDEIYILKDGGDYFNIGKWEDLIPLKPMLFDRTNYLLSHPSNLNTENTIYFIDIKLMAIQYLKYSKAMSSLMLGYNERVFLHQYVYTNAIGGFFNLGVRNTYLNFIVSYEENTHPFYVYDTSKYFEDDAMVMLEHTHKKRVVEYDNLLDIIHGVGGSTLTYMQTTMPYFTKYNILPYFLIYGNLIIDTFDNLNSHSKDMFFNNSVGINIFFRYVKSTNIRNIDCGMFEYDKDKIYKFMKKIKG